MIGLLLAGFALPVQAQVAVNRPPNTGRNIELLAQTMGAVHYLSVACEGRKRQDWRDRMVELLELENPGYQVRARLIQAFNEGYRSQERLFPTCSAQMEPQINAQILLKSKQGRILSDALADPYLR